MGIQVKINDALIIANSTIEDTDVEDAQLGLEARAWFLRMIGAHPSITKIELEVV